MRYLLQDNFKNELPARRSYLYNALNLWFTINDNFDGFIQLTSFPRNCIDALFIVGHNLNIKKHLEKHIIPEEIIVAITCDIDINIPTFKCRKGKLYIAKQNKQKQADLYIGNDYGFDFDITESELIFYNSKHKQDFQKRVESSFNKQVGGNRY